MTAPQTNEDKVFHGRLIGINDLITYEGDSVKTLREDFISAIEGYIEVCAEIGKEPEKSYKGSFNVRIEPELHKQLVIFSLAHKKSLNATVAEAIRKYLN